MNFVAITFDDAPRVSKFLTQTEFDFTHVVNVREYIEQIGSSPYPENIFINKQGKIEYIEGGLFGKKVEYFEGILEKLIE